MTQLSESLKQLYARRTFGIKLGLEVEQSLLAHLNGPQQAYGIVHVAGTNGKGSVCAILESILRSAGIKTGLYTSPHLVRFNERIRVNGDPVADHELTPLVACIEQLAHAVSKETGSEPTFFECATAMALQHFRSNNIQVALLETGMGGRLDATNVCDPLLSVITRISMEHAEHLGADIQSIAAEKAGIIKAGKPVVCGATDETALRVITRTAREHNAPVLCAPDHISARLIKSDITGQKISIESSSASYGTIDLPLIGPHQIENLCTAVAAVEILGQTLGIEFSPWQVQQGAKSTEWPGRSQLINSDPPVILDGAHNPGAGEMLAKTLERTFGHKPVGLIVGMCGDKDPNSFLKAFSRIAKRIWIVPLQSERSMESEKIASAARSLGFTASEAALASAFDQSKLWASETDGVVCITGSLFLVGEVLGNRCD